MDVKNNYERVKLILVDKIPLNVLAHCIPDPKAVLNEYDQDVVRGMCERNSHYQLSDKSVTYTYPVTYVKKLYFLNASEVSISQLLLILAKFPKAEIVLFLTKEDESQSKLKPSLSLLETNYQELKIENQRKNTNPIEISYVPPVTITLDAEELVERFKKEISDSVLNTI